MQALLYMSATVHCKDSLPCDGSLVIRNTNTNKDGAPSEELKTSWCYMIISDFDRCQLTVYP